MEFSGLGRRRFFAFVCLGRALNILRLSSRDLGVRVYGRRFTLSPLSASGCVENQLYGYGVACFRVWGSSLEVGVSENRGTSFWGP